MKQIKRMHSFILAAILAISTMFVAPPITVASSSTNYILTGNYADDVVAIANAQAGKTWSDLGAEMTAASNGISYNGNWCGNFVWWCGYKAGLVSNGFYPSNDYFATAINPALWFAKSGGGKIYIYNEFYSKFLGRTEEGWKGYADAGIVQSVSKSFAPQKGDIIIYGKPYTDRERVLITHTGYIRANTSNGNIYTVEGNTGSGVKLRNITANYYDATYLGYPIGYVRPSYAAVSSNEPANGETTSQSVVSVTPGTYQIQAYCGKVVEVENSGKGNKANVQIWTNIGIDCQKFKIAQVSGDYYTITAVHSGKAIDVADGSAARETNIWQWTPNGSDAQKWKFEDAGNGYVYIRSALGTYMDVSGDGSANGTNIWAYTFKNV